MDGLPDGFFFYIHLFAFRTSYHTLYIIRVLFKLINHSEYKKMKVNDVEESLI